MSLTVRNGRYPGSEKFLPEWLFKEKIWQTTMDLSFANILREKSAINNDSDWRQWL
jgi:hypothetical protein